MSLPTRDEALRQIREFGLSVENLEVDSGKIIRCSYLDKGKRNKDGFYQVYSMDNTQLVSGFFGAYYPYKIVNTLEVSGNSDFKPSANDKIKHEQKLALIKKSVLNEEPDLSIWGRAEQAKEHSYLTKKQIPPHDFRVIGKELLIPFQDREGEIVGVQRILENGKKFMVKNSKMKGAYHEIVGSDVVALCEGVATSASIHKATGWTTVACYSASNMAKVVGKFKTARLIICSDDDWETEKKTGKNTGEFEAKKIAKKYHCESVSPVFEEKRLTDWNDLAVSEGIEKVKTQLLKYVPKTFIQKIGDLDNRERQEQFLIDNSSLLAEYDAKSFSFLKNRLKEMYNISKGFMDDCVQNEKSEAELQIIEDAKDKLKTVRFDGKNYLKIEDEKVYNTTSQEISLLVNLASDGNDVLKQEMLNTIHKDKLIGETISQAIPFGKTFIRERIGKRSRIVIESFVSTQESLDLRLAQLDDVKLDQKFISYIEKEYPEIIDIWLASLARKFCHHKKTFVYLCVNTHFGKNFFFELPNLVRTFHRAYQIEDFKGNSPEDFVEPLFLFVDEADKFPVHYKTNIPEYKRLYGGLTSITLGMRVLACANKLEDIDRGIDPQLVERIVKISPSNKRFDHHGIQQKTSQQMWEKYIINKMLNKLMEWSHEGDFDTNCGEYYEKFVEKYHFSDYVSLEDVLYDNLSQLVETMFNKMDSMTEFKSGSFEFSNHIFFTDSRTENEIVITSPKRFFQEVFKYFDESRLKAFQKKYPNKEDLESIEFLESKLCKSDGKTKRGLTFLIENDGNEIKIVKKLHKSANKA